MISVVGKSIIKKASNYIKKRNKEKEDELEEKSKNTSTIHDDDSVIEERKDVDDAR